MKTNLQTTTHIGIYSMLGGFLNIFQDVKLHEFMETFKGLTFGQLISILIPFAIGVWAIMHKGDKS